MNMYFKFHGLPHQTRHRMNISFLVKVLCKILLRDFNIRYHSQGASRPNSFSVYPNTNLRQWFGFACNISCQLHLCQTFLKWHGYIAVYITTSILLIHSKKLPIDPIEIQSATDGLSVKLASGSDINLQLYQHLKCKLSFGIRNLIDTQKRR